MTTTNEPTAYDRNEIRLQAAMQSALGAAALHDGRDEDADIHIQEDSNERVEPGDSDSRRSAG